MFCSPLRRHPGMYPTLLLVEFRRPRTPCHLHQRAIATSELHLTGASVVDLGWEPDTTRTGRRSGLPPKHSAPTCARFPAAARTPHLPHLFDVLAADPPDVIVRRQRSPRRTAFAGIFEAPVVSLVLTLATNTAFTPAELIDGFTPEPSGHGRCFGELTGLVHLYGQPSPTGTTSTAHTRVTVAGVRAAGVSDRR